jgi:hypothetical protein
MAADKDKAWRDWQQQDRVRRQAQAGLANRMPAAKKPAGRLFLGMSLPWFLIVGALALSLSAIGVLIAQSVF